MPAWYWWSRRCSWQADWPALRTLHLRLNERWEYAWAAGIGLVAMQLGAALHYLPLTPVRFGLAAAGSDLRTDRAGCQPGGGQSLSDGRFFEPTVMLHLFWGLAIWFR